jgi:hypothetical protein
VDEGVVRVLVVAGEIDDSVLTLQDELGQRGFHSTVVLSADALSFWHEHADELVAVVAEFREILIPLLEKAAREVVVLVHGAAFDDPGALHFWTPVPREPRAIVDALASRLRSAPS